MLVTRLLCDKSFLLGVVFVLQWVQSEHMKSEATHSNQGGHTMAVHSTTQLANGHTLTITEQVDCADRHQCFRVEERNGLGTFIAFAFSGTVGACESWVQRAKERGYGLRPSVGPNVGNVVLTQPQADLVYGMLTQRLYLRSDDPEREVVQSAREAVYPMTSACGEAREAAAELGIDFPPTASERIRAARESK